jgi:hypothetical protein
MFDRLVRRLGVTAFLGLSCCHSGTLSPPATPGVLVPPDAVAEIVFPTVDGFVQLIRSLGAAGLVPGEHRWLSRSGLIAAGVREPIAVAERSGGGSMLIGGLLSASLFREAIQPELARLGLRSQRVLGDVDALVDAAESTRALLRVGNGTIVIVVNPTDVIAEAALVEALAVGSVNGIRRNPAEISWRLRPPPPTALMIGSADGVLRQEGARVLLEGSLHPTAASLLTPSTLAGALAPSWCVAETGAVMVAHLPSLTALVNVAGVNDLVGGSADAFDGRLTVALFAPSDGVAVDEADVATLGALVVVGRPRAAAIDGLRRSVEESVAGLPMSSKTVGSHAVRSVSVRGRPWRDVSTVVADDLFALGVGAPIVVDRVAAGLICPKSARLLSVDGPALLKLIERARLDVRLLRRVASLTGTDDPLALLAAVERLEIDARPAADPVDPQSVAISAQITFTTIKSVD